MNYTPLYVYIFFIHSFVNKHLGCSHLSAIWIMLLQILVCGYLIKYLLAIIELHGNLMLNSKMLICWQITILFCVVATPFFILTSSAHVFQFLYIHHNFLIFCSFDNSYFNEYEVVNFCIVDMLARTFRTALGL